MSFRRCLGVLLATAAVFTLAYGQPSVSTADSSRLDQPWDEVQRRCVGTPEYARRWCSSNYAGSTPLFKNATQFDCNCPQGTWPNARHKRCLPHQEFANDDCATRFPGTVPRWRDANRWNCESTQAAPPRADRGHRS